MNVSQVDEDKPLLCDQKEAWRSVESLLSFIVFAVFVSLHVMFSDVTARSVLLVIVGPRLHVILALSAENPVYKCGARCTCRGVGGSLDQLFGTKSITAAKF